MKVSLDKLVAAAPAPVAPVVPTPVFAPAPVSAANPALAHPCPTLYAASRGLPRPATHPCPTLVAAFVSRPLPAPRTPIGTGLPVASGLAAVPSAMEIKAVRVPNQKADLLREEQERANRKMQQEAAREAMWNHMAITQFAPVKRTRFTMKPASFWVNLTPMHLVKVKSGDKVTKGAFAPESKSRGIPAGQNWFNRNSEAWQLQQEIAAMKRALEAKKAEQARKEKENEAKVAMALDNLSALAKRPPTFVERAIKAFKPFVPLAKVVVPFMAYMTMEMLQK
ncbi:hypothetical protein TWF481_011109 [Arthrobotrys musiformis]|uniref:Uncharacterized protein n=1 Tax=Arthrobotrys musiformis TaxID=47236 RepID=A0AAV9VXB7_9PEZI